MDFIELDRLHLAALRLEWRLARQGLPPAIRDHLRLPSFEMHDTPTLWGLWRGDRHALSFNRSLARNEDWPCVVEVLRHEMAHQIADQVFRAREAPHGPRFLQACRLLRADPRASSSLPSIYQRIEAEADGLDDKRDTIRKLLALAASPHAGEAEAAMLKAHALMVKYNVTPDPDHPHEYASLCLGEIAVRHTGADYALASLLRDFFFVETVYISMVRPTTGHVGRILEVTGTHENVKMASYIFDFLLRAAEGEACDLGIWRKGQTVDYALGFYQGVREQLTKQRADIVAPHSKTHALIHAAASRLNAVIRERYTGLRTARNRGRNIDTDTYDAGVEAGRQVVLHKPIEHRHAGRAPQGRLEGSARQTGDGCRPHPTPLPSRG